MKFRTTSKALREGAGRLLACGYCEMQELLNFKSPVAYTCGVYGWNYDVYDVDGVMITTGYRGTVGKKPDRDLLNEYENRARRINHSDLSWAERESAVNKLLSEFVAKAV